MKRCVNCGAHLDDLDKVCSICKTIQPEMVKVEPDNNFKYCSHCGTKIPKEVKVCPNCNYVFKKTKVIIEESYNNSGAIVSLVFSIISLALSLLSFPVGVLSFVSFALSIPGFIISLACKASPNWKATTFVLNAVAIVAGVVVSFLFVVHLKSIGYF